MPRYKYQCEFCNDIVVVFHGINEVFLNCEKCLEKQTMRKVLSTPMIIKKETTSNKKNVGDITKQYIEENKQILEQQKIEARNDNEQA